MRSFLGLALLALAACDAAAVDDPADIDVAALSKDPALLVGQWELISTTTVGWAAPVTTTAVAPGLAAYVFRPDGTATVAANGRFRAETEWAVESLEQVGTVLRIGAEAEYGRAFFGVTARRLYIDHRPADGPLKTYARR